MRGQFESLLPTQWPVFAQMAETAGSSHSGSTKNIFSVPMTVVAGSVSRLSSQRLNLAAHTQRIRIGFSVLLLPFITLSGSRKNSPRWM